MLSPKIVNIIQPGSKFFRLDPEVYLRTCYRTRPTLEFILFYPERNHTAAPTGLFLLTFRRRNYFFNFSTPCI